MSRKAKPLLEWMEDIHPEDLEYYKEREFECLMDDATDFVNKLIESPNVEVKDKGKAIEEKFEELKSSGDYSNDGIRDMIYQDQDYWQHQWEWVEDDLTILLNELNPDGYWKAVVHNFGWRNVDGQRYFQSNEGADFLNKVLPNTNNNFRIFKDGKGLKIQNFHHDSPTGNEWYYLRPIKQSTYEKFK